MIQWSLLYNQFVLGPKIIFDNLRNYVVNIKSCIDLVGFIKSTTLLKPGHHSYYDTRERFSFDLIAYQPAALETHILLNYEPENLLKSQF